MKQPLLSLLALLLLIPLWSGSLHAEDLDVTGENVAGRATLDSFRAKHPGSRDRIRVSVTFETFGDDGKKVDLTGRGYRTRKGIVWSYKEKYTPGINKVLSAITFGAYKKKRKTRKVEVRMKRGPNDSYTGTIKGVRQTWKAAPDRDGLVFLAIPGLSTNNWNKVGIPYMDENLATMRRRGFKARRLNIKTEASVSTNAAFIRREIMKEGAQGRRVVLFAHSKGGTDATAALALYPETHRHVAGVVCIQPVYKGSPIADLASQSRILNASVKVIFEKLFKGEREAVTDLTHKTRSGFIRKFPYPADEIPTVVLRSTFDRRWSKSPLWLNQKLIEHKYKKKSDGMVSPADQTIPGAFHTDRKDLDHFEPGLRNESPHTPVAVTNDLIDLILPRLKEKEEPEVWVKDGKKQQQQQLKWE